MRRGDRLPRALLFWSGIAFLAFGCVNSTKLNEADKAKLVIQKRNQAKDLMAKIALHQAKELKELEELARIHHETTELLPATCPNCRAAYGEALSMLGWYYWDQCDDLLSQAENEKGDRARELRKQAEEPRKKWMDYFTRSNLEFDMYFKSEATPHPYFIERVMRHYELMGNYDRALYYLEKILQATPNIDPVVQENFSRLESLYRKERQKQKERGIKAGEEKAPRRLQSRQEPDGSRKSEASGDEDR